MSVAIVEEPPARLAEYGAVPIGFTVAEVFDEAGIAALLRGEAAEPRPVSRPYRKDYDAQGDNGPAAWPRRFDVSRWIVLAAHRDARRVGGAVLVVDDPQLDLLEDCPSCALLWDLRVAPAVRAQGVGSALLHAAEDRARRHGALALRVETQQINVPACRFYMGHGFRLECATPGAYAELPDEVQLLWRKTLA